MASIAARTRDVYYSYDLRGLMTNVRFDTQNTGDGDGYVYSGFGELTQSTQAMDGATRVLSHVFDRNGNQTQVTYPDSQTFTYAYDGLNRATQVLNPASALIQSVTYNPNGTAQRSDRATGAPAQTFGYDSTLRLNSAAIVQNLSSANDVSWSYARNPASQITTETRDNDSYAWTDHVDVTRTYTANGLNQYTAAGSASFTYDANGNLTSDGSTTYIYDIENRLVSAADGTTTITLRYDPMGRLYELAENGTPTRRFLHDGDALVGEYDAAGTLLARHVHGPDGSADDPLASFAGTTSTDLASAQFLYRDPRGSIVLMSNAAGTDVDINTYDEYGIPGAGNTGRFQYTGQVWLDEIGMYYYKARIYSPTLGRFLQTDPIGYEDQFNLYAYVGNDPVNGVDPTGTECKPTEGGDSNCDGEVNEEDTKTNNAPTENIVVEGKKPTFYLVTPKEGCLGVAWAKNRQAIIGDSIGLAASALPGGRPAVALAGLAIGAGVLTNTAMTGNKERPGLTIGSLSLGIAGIHVTSAGPFAEAYKATSTLAKNLPGIGAVIAGGALILDAANVYQDYKACQNN